MSLLRPRRKRSRLSRWLLLLFIAGLFIPQRMQIPVKGATVNSWNPKSFWYFPWGRSGTHKGIDIFAAEGTPVFSSSHGIVMYKGTNSMGGNVIVVLGPKWRVYYYAHLKEFHTSMFSLLHPGEKIGLVGATGNAQGKQPHLHYSIATLVPYPWRIDSTEQGWKKMFYLDPGRELTKSP